MSQAGFFNRRANRRSVMAGSVGAALAISGGMRHLSAQETPAASPTGGEADSRHLIVADPEAAALYVYAIPGLELTGHVDDVVFGVHNGLLQLPDGRLVFSDDNTGEVLAVTIDAAGVPAVTQRVAVNSGNRLVWSSVDPEFRYLVGASQIEDSTVQVANVIDLATFTNTEYEIGLVGEEELHAWIAGDPAVLYASVGGEIHSHLLSDLEAGNATPIEVVPVELRSHGAVADAAHDQFLLVTNEGFEVTDISTGPALYRDLIPWDVDGFAGGRNSRPRLHNDGTHIFGRLNATPDDPTQWAEVEVTTHIANTADLTAQRFALGKGNFGFRWGISDPYVLFAGHDGVTGGAYLVDVDSDSETFGTVVGLVELDLPSGAATPGEDSAGTETYLTALTQDGALGFVVHGGDGIISVID
ncbi:MAG TPA: hypothetical protein VNZ58_01750, partial [Thermomicrobiales bacterium]|nr:hypothetical protein [Thermomicrobiales bacterium]